MWSAAENPCKRARVLKKGLMHPARFVILGLAALGIVSCASAPLTAEYNERRAVIQERITIAQAYSEFLRGRYASLTNDPHQASIFYARAARSNPDDTELLERAVFTTLISGNVTGATRIAGNATPSTLGDSSLPRLVLAVNALRVGQTRRVETLLVEQSSSLFNDTIHRSLIAWTMADRNQTAQAIDLLKQIKSGDPLLDGLTLATQGYIQLHAQDEAAAMVTFQTMWDNGLRLASTTETLARLLARADRRAEAIEITRIFSTQIGQNAAIQTLHLQLEAGRSIALDRPSITEGGALAIYIPAAALATQTDNDLAGLYFALALNLDPDLHVARTLWGNALDKADRRRDAIQTLEAVPNSSVFYATARGQIAWALRRQERNEEALTAARQALAFARDRNLKVQLGDLFRSLGEPEDAEAILTEVITADTANNIEDWRLFYARGAAREQQDRWAEAETDLMHASELAPNQPALLNYLGYSWVDRGENLDEAFAMIKRAVELRPNAGFIVDSLGWAYFKRGNYEEAVKHLERAVELSPGEPALNEHLGDAYWRVGRELEAGFQWKHAIRLATRADAGETDNLILLKAKLETGLDNAAALVAEAGTP